jgi:hypothetical protein
MLRSAIVRTASIALLVTMAGAACSGRSHSVETGISPARAVAPSTVAHGATIRFVLGTDSLPTVGHLSKLTADSLIIERCGCVRLRYGTGEINRLEVLRGSSRGKHFAAGLGIGVLAGLIIAGVNYARPCHALDTDVCGARTFGLFLYGPPLGALIGGIVGLALPTSQRWEPVAAQQRSARIPNSTS